MKTFNYNVNLTGLTIFKTDKEQFDAFLFPHVRYINVPENLNPTSKHLYYLGGEPPDNDSKLIIGKLYELTTVLYSEDETQNRKRVCVCTSHIPTSLTCSILGRDLDNKYCRVNIKNFGTIADIRDRKIEEVIGK